MMILSDPAKIPLMHGIVCVIMCGVWFTVMYLMRLAVQ